MARSLSANGSSNGNGLSETTNTTEMLPLAQLVPVLAALLLGMLLAALDQTVVGTSMPRIIGELGGQNISWVYTAYLLASTVMVPIYGKLSDIYGRRIFFIGGMVIFLLGSALSGTSQNMTQLIFYRAIQGLGAGALMPIAQAIIGDIFPPAERGKWQGLFVAVFGLATILGPLLGGFITDHWTWRWVFYVNMPVGAVALVAAALALPKQLVRRQHKIDYLGSATLVAWSVPLLLALSFGGSQYAWGSWQIITLFAVAAVMLVAFIVIELNVAEPIISPRLFKSDIFSISVVSMFLLSAGMFGVILYLPFFAQDVLGQSATNTGVILTPMMLGFMVSSLIGGQLLSRTGRYKILALVGFVVATVGMFLLAQMTIHTTNGELVRDMIIVGLGIGVMISLFTIVVQNAFPVQQIGEVTGSLTFFRAMGSTIGLAVLGSIITNTLTSKLQSNMPAALRPFIPASSLTNLSSQSQSGSSGDKLKEITNFVFTHFGHQQGLALLGQLQLAIKTSFASAITEALFFGAITMAVAFVVTLFLREIPLRKGRGTSANELLQDAAPAPEPLMPEPVA